MIDFASQLIRLFAVHPARLASPFGPDLAESLKDEDATRVLGTDVGNAAGNLMSSVFIHVPYMPPELLITPLSLDGFARLPLLFGDACQVLIAVLVQPMIGDKDGFNDPLILAHTDHGEIFHIQVDGHRHQVRITHALNDLFGLDLFRLAEVQFRRLLAQDQLGTLLLPTWLGATPLKESAVLDGIVNPGPSTACVDLESHKRLAQIQAVQAFPASCLMSSNWPDSRGRTSPCRGHP